MDSKDIEKVTYIEQVETTKSSASDTLSDLHAFTPEESRKIRHRVDRALIPICGLMYCVSLLDRTNLSNASIAGMTVDLKLKAPGPDRYSIITLVFCRHTPCSSSGKQSINGQ